MLFCDKQATLLSFCDLVLPNVIFTVSVGAVSLCKSNTRFAAVSIHMAVWLLPEKLNPFLLTNVHATTNKTISNHELYENTSYFL